MVLYMPGWITQEVGDVNIFIKMFKQRLITVADPGLTDRKSLKVMTVEV